MDIWGRIYRDQWEGDPHPHVVERDDGRRDEIESAAQYFEAPRLDLEAKAFHGLAGPVLDVAAGPGSYAIHLQNHGLTVVAIDSSPLAIKIARLRGCLDAQVMDLRELEFPPASFESIIVMGNSFGAYQTPESLPGYLARLRGLTSDGGVLLTTTTDPLDTEDAGHLLYHARNRESGRPPGLTKIRLGYRELVSDWFHLWHTTRDEVGPIAASAGWDLEDEAAEGPWRVRRFRAVSPAW